MSEHKNALRNVDLIIKDKDTNLPTYKAASKEDSERSSSCWIQNITQGATAVIAWNHE